MCLYPRLILNKKYLPTRKNNFQPPVLKDGRLKYVSVGCGKCIECLKQKAREWKIRLNEELKEQTHAYFVTLTFDCDKLESLMKETKQGETNALATIATRRFLERYRKKNKVSLKHWLITELGHTGTERIHLHGLLFPKEEMTKEEIEKIWNYGWVFVGEYVNGKTINYITKYVTKLDTDHKHYVPIILCSSGIGSSYFKSARNTHAHAFNNTRTRGFYKLPDGTILNLPIYYRNHFYTEEQREELWKQKIDKHTIYVLGTPYDISTDEGRHIYEEVLKSAQEYNRLCGYGDDSKEWKKHNYNVTLRMLNKEKCIFSQKA